MSSGRLAQGVLLILCLLLVLGAIDVALPREMTFAEGKALSNIPADQQNTTMAWGAQFANKILVHCP